MKIKRQKVTWFTVGISVFSLLFVTAVANWTSPANAKSQATNSHLITIYDRGTERSVISDKDTLREIFKSADIALDDNDVVEPGLDEELVAPAYKVNVYRARPVTIIDGNARIRVMSAQRTAKEIVRDAKLPVLQQEDDTSFRLTADYLQNGASTELVISRATPVKLLMYGEAATVYTKSKTVAEFLTEKDINIGKNDTLSVKKTSPIKKGMTIEVWRNGKQTVTEKEQIAPPVRQIQDSDRKVGYREVKTAGSPGEKLVTYEVIMKNGREVSRKEIKHVVTKQPTEKVEIVGTKPSFDGDFGAALAKLRSCEGGYNSWNPAGPYYGAYQFDRGTWAGVTSAPYGNATPAEQDAAARTLYERRGWQPWPVCGASLPDIYR
ncbi:G5 domain-containing protein [Candidatus Nomurabacteria bacterium]|nr:G5 domain-containing protein [Candidatus Nomurabacteria bacterium]